MVIYRDVDIILELLLPPIFHIIYTIMKKYYSDETVNIHIQPFINIIKENNRVITNKRG